jgi:hypothetical protein
MIRQAGNVTRMEETKSVYKILVGKLLIKRPFVKVIRRCEYNVKVDLWNI